MAVAQGVILFSVVMFTSFSKGTGVAVNMTCPARLVEEEVNSVTCRIDTAEISTAGCISSPTNVLFQIKGQVNPLCTSLYTSSCNVSPNSIDEGSCECTEQTGDVKIYLFKFKGKAEDYNGTKLECKVCAAIPEITIPPTNCDSLEYADNCPSCDNGKCVRTSDDLRTPSCLVSICYTTLVILMLVLALAALASTDSIAIYLCVWKKIQWTDCCQNKAFVFGLVSTSAVWVICMTVAFIYGCTNFPEDDPRSLCVVVIVFTAFCVVVDVITVIVIFVRTYPGWKNKFLLLVLLCAFFALRIVAYIIVLIVYIVYRCTKETSPPPTTPTQPPTPPPVTIISRCDGQSRDEYKLKWTTDDADIEEFSVTYVQVEGDTSDEPKRPIKPIGEQITSETPITVDGNIWYTTLKPLSADTFYQVTIKTNGSSEKGSLFIFKTAK